MCTTLVDGLGTSFLDLESSGARALLLVMSLYCKAQGNFQQYIPDIAQYIPGLGLSAAYQSMVTPNNDGNMVGKCC